MARQRNWKKYLAPLVPAGVGGLLFFAIHLAGTDPENAYRSEPWQVGFFATRWLYICLVIGVVTLVGLLIDDMIAWFERRHERRLLGDLGPSREAGSREKRAKH